jgi:hypothetical protein
MAAEAARPSLTANPSRKRSREEFDDLDPASLQGVYDNGTLANMEVIEEPIMGEGMTLIDPQTGRASAAESQTGTWYENQLEEERRAAADAAAALEQEQLDAQGRPSKTVRLDSPAPGSALVDSPTNIVQQPLAATPAPAIDSASMMLGIGWKEVASDADMEQAARGWARYIENHYPMLGGVEMLCKSDGHEVFLAKATAPQESYWLFKDDLTEGKLVATSQEQCIANLRAVPMAFENDTVLSATAPAAVSDAVSAAPTPMGETLMGANELVAAGAGDNMMFD